MSTLHVNCSGFPEPSASHTQTLSSHTHETSSCSVCLCVQKSLSGRGFRCSPVLELCYVLRECIVPCSGVNKEPKLCGLEEWARVDSGSGQGASDSEQSFLEKEKIWRLRHERGKVILQGPRACGRCLEPPLTGSVQQSASVGAWFDSDAEKTQRRRRQVIIASEDVRTETRY